MYVRTYYVLVFYRNSVCRSAPERQVIRLSRRFAGHERSRLRRRAHSGHPNFRRPKNQRESGRSERSRRIVGLRRHLQRNRFGEDSKHSDQSRVSVISDSDSAHYPLLLLTNDRDARPSNRFFFLVDSSTRRIPRGPLIDFGHLNASSIGTYVRR